MTADEAIKVALDVLYKEIEIPEEDDIICTQIEETDEGFYIECNSRIYTEKDDLMYALVLAPIVVRSDGSYSFVF